MLIDPGIRFENNLFCVEKMFTLSGVCSSNGRLIPLMKLIVQRQLRPKEMFILNSINSMKKAGGYISNYDQF